MNHEGESMDVINQGNLFKILKASQIEETRMQKVTVNVRMQEISM